jgi:hypothetical protein
MFPLIFCTRFGSPHLVITSDLLSPTDATPPGHWKSDKGSAGGKAKAVPTNISNMAAITTKEIFFFLIIITLNNRLNGGLPDADLCFLWEHSARSAPKVLFSQHKVC